MKTSRCRTTCRRRTSSPRDSRTPSQHGSGTGPPTPVRTVFDRFLALREAQQVARPSHGAAPLRATLPRRPDWAATTPTGTTPIRRRCIRPCGPATRTWCGCSSSEGRAWTSRTRSTRAPRWVGRSSADGQRSRSTFAGRARPGERRRTAGRDVFGRHRHWLRHSRCGMGLIDAGIVRDDCSRRTAWRRLTGPRRSCQPPLGLSPAHGRRSVGA